MGLIELNIQELNKVFKIYFNVMYVCGEVCISQNYSVIFVVFVYIIV